MQYTAPLPMGEIRRPKRNLFKKYFENFLPFTFRRSFEADLRISLFWGIKKAGSEDPASIRQIGIYRVDETQRETEKI